MGSTIYEFRTFEALPLSTDISESDLVDLYVYKEGFTSIGVKIRNPHLTSKDNYKFHKIEVKQMLSQNGDFQEWRKDVLKLEESFVLKIHKLHKFNNLLKDNLNKLELQTETLKKWLEIDVQKVVQIVKLKSKALGSENATLNVTILGEESKNWKFSSVSVEGSDLNVLKQRIPKNNGKNTSYPQLLEQILGKQ